MLHADEKTSFGQPSVFIPLEGFGEETDLVLVPQDYTNLVFQLFVGDKGVWMQSG